MRELGSLDSNDIDGLMVDMREETDEMVIHLPMGEMPTMMTR
jgi:hypothetical protein